MKKRLAIICTHPVQYYAPVFQMLGESASLELKVFYTLGEQAITNHYDQGFLKTITWDIPLLEGYHYEFLKNTSTQPKTGRFYSIVNPEAINRISEFLPDAILVYGWSNASHLKILRYFKGELPVWFRGDSHLLDKQNFLKKYIRKLSLKWVYTHVDKAFYVGSANKAYYLNHGLQASQLIFAPHAVDNRRFAEDRQKEVLQLRTEIGAVCSDIIIMFAGKLEAKKDPALLLYAFEKIYRPGLVLMFVGNGVLEHSLKETARCSKVANAVHFRDFQNQQVMPVFYQACDIFCLPSSGPGETWGLAINEAMAAKKPVIASDRVGCAADLISESNGFIFEAKNVSDLVQKLLSLCEDGSTLKGKGEHSFNVIKDWTFDAQVKTIKENLYA